MRLSRNISSFISLRKRRAALAVIVLCLWILSICRTRAADVRWANAHNLSRETRFATLPASAARRAHQLLRCSVVFPAVSDRDAKIDRQMTSIPTVAHRSATFVSCTTRICRHPDVMLTSFRRHDDMSLADGERGSCVAGYWRLRCDTPRDLSK